MTANLVSSQWLAKHLENPDILVLDASWHMPALKRNARAEFVDAHIPGAQFFDLDAASDTNTSLPHMMPSVEKFARDMQELGAANDKHIIAYDTLGLFSAARLWWMLKSFGHEQVSILDGGLPRWQGDGHPLESGEASVPDPQPFSPSLNTARIKNITEVALALSNDSAQIADARSPPRFRGEEVEPRPGVRAGHMPGAFNVHYASLLDSNGTLKSTAALRSVFESAGLDLARPIITSCGSGVTAAMLSLALEEIGIKNHSLYDGSWTEWGASEREVALG